MAKSPSSFPHIHCLTVVGLSSPQQLLPLVLTEEASLSLSRDIRCLCLAEAYYTILLGCSQSKLTWGRDWEKYYLPTVTVRNACQACVIGIFHCIFADAGSQPKHFAEKVCEHYYSSIKSSFRGSLSIRDGLMGCQKKHLSNLRCGLLPQPASSRFGAPLTLSIAKEICTKGLSHALRTSTLPNLPLKNDLLSWFVGYGHHLQPAGVKKVMQKRTLEGRCGLG